MTSSESRRMNYLTRGEPRSISGQRQNGLLAAPWSFCSRRRRTMSDRVSTWRSVIGASTLRSKQGCEICACNGARLNEKEFLREGNRRLHTMKGKLLAKVFRAFNSSFLWIYYVCRHVILKLRWYCNVTRLYRSSFWNKFKNVCRITSVHQ